MSSLDAEILGHILDEVDYLIDHSRGLSRDAFLRDQTLRRAFVRSLEIIGEATKKLSSSVTTEAADVDWRSMAGMRDRLIHGYFGVDYELVWDVVRHKIPPLGERVRHLLTRIDADPS